MVVLSIVVLLNVQPAAATASATTNSDFLNIIELISESANLRQEWGEGKDFLSVMIQDCEISFFSELLTDYFIGGFLAFFYEVDRDSNLFRDPFIFKLSKETSRITIFIFYTSADTHPKQCVKFIFPS